jgi:hypothetical protein
MNLNWVISRFMHLGPRVVAVTCLIIYSYYAVDFLMGWGKRLLGPALIVPEGFPVGGDFSHFWMAATLAWGGDPTGAYDPATLQGALAAFFGLPLKYAFPYPPTFLLVLLPLALLPYLTSLAVWQSTTLTGYLLVLGRIAPHPLALWLSLIFPGVYLNFSFGQNGLLSAALLGGGLLLLNRFPLSAGVLLGLLTYKPHLAFLVPVALLAGGRRRALGAMVATAAGLALASVLVLGYEVWVAFWRTLPVSMKLLETGRTASGMVMYKMPTIFAGAILLGAGVTLAWALQGMAMLGIGALVVWTWFRGTSLALEGSILVLAILLFMPFGFVYDLALMALPLAWIGWEGHTQGWLPGEKLLLIIGWAFPFFLTQVTGALSLPLAPLVLTSLLILTIRRARLEARSREVNFG